MLTGVNALVMVDAEVNDMVYIDQVKGSRTTVE